MAGKSLGTLTIDLIAKVGGFVQGMDKAERSSQKWRDQVKKDAKEVGASIAAIGVAAATAAVGVGVAGIAIVKSTAQQVSEADRWAKSLKMSTQDLLSWQYAAEQAGLTGDNIADIFKDINDKVGDAVLNKSGEAAQALDTLGLSAQKLAQQSPDKQLLAISSALQKIPTQAGKTNLLESLGNDLSKMLPLFDNNNEKLKQFIQLSKDFGVAPPQEDIDNLVKVNRFFQDIETSAKGLKIEIASGLAKVNLDPLKDAFGDIKKTLTDPSVLQGLSDLVSGVAQLAGYMIRIAAEAGKLAAIATRFSSRVGSQVINGVDVSSYDNSSSIDARLLELAGQVASYNAPGNDIARKYGSQNNIDGIQKEIAALQQRKKFLLDNASAEKEVQSILNDDNNYSLGSGESNQKTTPKSNATENAFKSRLLDLQKQAALIETTGKKTAEVTELEKINFDITSGNLKKLSEAQKEQLRSAAKALDSKKEELRLNQENARVAEYVSGLEKQNKLVRQGFDNQIVGRYSGSRERSRMQDNNDIQQDFASRQDDLLNQLQSGDIDQSLYDKKKEALQNSLDERLKIQEEYYKKQDELQNDGAAGFISGLATQIEASMDLYTNMQQVGAQAFSTLTDMIINWAETGKLNVKDFAATFLQSVGSTLLSYAAAQVAMAGLQAFTAMIGVPFVGPEIAGPAAIAATAAAGVLAIGVGTALQGQAHDGIDSVPETGTWLLQKGERVTTAKTSAKLDATLDRVANQSTGGGAIYSPTINIPINGNPSDATLALVRKAADEGAERGYRKAVNSVASGQGDLHKALMGKTTSGRKIS
ncbi:phage tail tape measure protein [Klebsiella quasipneumoniae]|uniref:phage tail tape measure protein n=5 Tax=Enterobacteriaceae TaxID=543 RepID=UPI001647B609|nr:phage tail tape measure protein [Klebsiella quasipneumoniae]MBC4290426.1 phage tail tape measure protein [Klebsiella quasipneumoniae]HBR1133546.1 phage tail tape measure protein [Klebsiella quasipneumoniae subsp. similipneumoniae]HBR2229110.1 phage tail tape measure protein [Klebsiella pneumoniae]